MSRQATAQYAMGYLACTSSCRMWKRAWWPTSIGADCATSLSGKI